MRTTRSVKPVVGQRGGHDLGRVDAGGVARRQRWVGEPAVRRAIKQRDAVGPALDRDDVGESGRVEDAGGHADRFVGGVRDQAAVLRDDDRGAQAGGEQDLGAELAPRTAVEDAEVARVGVGDHQVGPAALVQVGDGDFGGGVADVRAGPLPR